MACMENNTAPPSDGRATLEESVSEALTNVMTDLGSIEKDIPSETHLVMCDRLMVVKRKRENYVRVTYVHIKAVAHTSCCEEAEAQLVSAPKVTAIFRLLTSFSRDAPPGYHFLHGEVLQESLDAQVISYGSDERFFILNHEPVDM